MEELTSPDPEPPHRNPVSIPNPMRIAFAIFRYFPFGGLQCDMLRIAEELLRRGHEVTVFCRHWEGERPAGIRIVELRTGGYSNHSRAARFADAFRRELAKGGFDCSVAFNRFGGADFYFAADNPFYLTALRSVGRFWSRILPRYRAFIAQEREVFAPESKTVILGITRRQLIAFRHIYHTQESRCRLLPPGINPDRRRPPDAEARREKKRAELGLAPDEIMLLEVGSAFRTKGVDRAITALASLPDEPRDHTRLFVAGYGKEKPYLKLARRLGIDDRVKLLGGRKDVTDLLLAADLLLHPARNEATGTVLLEAIAAGTPVLCTSNCGFAPYVDAAGQVTLHLPFHQRELNRALLLTIATQERLAELKREAIAYGADADFYRRHEVAADIITGVRP